MPMKKSQIPTPALLVDLDKFEANLKAMADHCREAGVGIRPHSKTHKCPAVAKRQMAAGALGICAATVAEAEGLAAAGITGILLTSPIVEPVKIDRMLKVVASARGTMLAVGHPHEVELLAAAADRDGVNIDVLVDIDVGDRRTGVPPSEAMALANFIEDFPRLKVRGVQAYAGSASHIVGFEARKARSQEMMQLAADMRRELAKAGFDVKIFSGTSTGTYNIDPAVGVTELQCGSYVFMDVDYRRIGGSGGELYSDFAPSLTLLATVVSASHRDRVTIDAGTKSIDTTTTFDPEPVGRSGLDYARGGDEFGILTVVDGGAMPRIGDRLEFIVPHCDPTVHLHDRLYAVRGDDVVEVWPLVARRET